MTVEQGAGVVAHAAWGTSIVTAVLSLAAHAQPIISALAGSAAFICSCYGIAWYRKNLRAAKA